MLKLLSKENRQVNKLSEEIYTKIVNSARNQIFYTEYKVPDTNDGRFDMITLYMFFALNRLRGLKERYPEKLSQALFDFMFKDMDRSLRESGVGDLGVPKHMKRMMQGFNGRMHKYNETIDDKDLLLKTIINNVYGGEEISEDTTNKMLEHVLAEHKKINETTLEDIKSGNFDFIIGE